MYLEKLLVMNRYQAKIGELLPNKVRSVMQRGLGVIGKRFGTALGPFHKDVDEALRAYSLFNKEYPEAEEELDADIIRRAIDFDYISWPRRIRKYVQGRDVLDVGCGTGVHSIGYVVVGVKSYTGVDPFIRLDKDRAKNLRTRQWEEGFGWTPREVMEQFKRVELIPGKFEDIDSARLFDVAVLHNVTEHLMRIDEVIEGIASKLRPDGRILFNHHNFYCWNGHHHLPKTIDQIDPNDPEQKKYMDWGHIRFTPPEGHYFLRGLNKIKLDELKDIVGRHYEIEVWNEIPSSEKNGRSRLTDDIAARFPELTRRDLAIHNVFCVAAKKKAS